MLRMVFSSPGAWQAAKALVNQTHTHKKAHLYGSGFMGPVWMPSASVGLLLCRRRWEIDSDSGLPLSVRTAPVQIACNKPSAAKSRAKLWICHAASAWRPRASALPTGAALHARCSGQICPLSLGLPGMHRARDAAPLEGRAGSCPWN